VSATPHEDMVRATYAVLTACDRARAYAWGLGEVEGVALIPIISDIDVQALIDRVLPMEGVRAVEPFSWLDEQADPPAIQAGIRVFCHPSQTGAA
jgi:hypothetical protein